MTDATSSAVNRGSVLVDAQHRCRYPDIPDYLAAIDRYLTERGVLADECITLELANSVPAALTVLAVLASGRSVMLMPIDGRGARTVGTEYRGPRFARTIVTVRIGARAGSDLGAPATYLDVRRNADYDATTASKLRPERIYLRTSGSLGAPKLAACSHERFLRNVQHARERLRFTPAHRVALPTPIFHSFGLGPAFLGCFLSGASIDVQDRANLLRYFEREQAFDPNVAFVTPSFAEILVRGRRARRAYEFMVTGGDRIGRSTFFRSEELHGPLINAYGSTEMGFIFSGDLGMSSEQRFTTVGRPLPGVSFRIVQGSAAPADASVGALQIKHDFGFEGYVDLDGEPLRPAGAFDGDWYCSGDLARAGSDGTLEVLGRSDLSVNRNGLLLTFADVEARFREIDGVNEVAVAAGPESIRGRVLVAFCVLRRGAEQTEEQLRAEYAKRAPAFAVPEQVRIVNELPKLQSGKIDRGSLAARAAFGGAPADRRRSQR